MHKPLNFVYALSRINSRNMKAYGFKYPTQKIMIDQINQNEVNTQINISALMWITYLFYSTWPLIWFQVLKLYYQKNGSMTPFLSISSMTTK